MQRKSNFEIKSMQSVLREAGIARKEAVLKLNLAEHIQTQAQLVNSNAITHEEWLEDCRNTNNQVDSEVAKIIAEKIRSGLIVTNSVNIHAFNELATYGNFKRKVWDASINFEVTSISIFFREYPQRVWNQIEIYGSGRAGRKLWDWRI